MNETGLLASVSSARGPALDALAHRGLTGLRTPGMRPALWSFSGPGAVRLHDMRSESAWG